MIPIVSHTRTTVDEAGVIVEECAFCMIVNIPSCANFHKIGTRCGHTAPKTAGDPATYRAAMRLRRSHITAVKRPTLVDIHNVRSFSRSCSSFSSSHSHLYILSTIEHTRRSLQSQICCLDCNHTHVKNLNFGPVIYTSTLLY